MLRRYVPDALPLVRKADWHCSECDSDYHGEHYCLTCRTGDYSRAHSSAADQTAEVTECAY
ncbi:TPA: hypothetical protein OMD55_003233 [Klebsiella michiganensis]|uniref:putative zinc ribbon protein n=1 Tax=Klebsiella quasipneumoniae TaxID=1463165 RepID=UPI0010343BDE|nr:hypothetical protein [Klebsiella oxytoca]HCQ8236591.1 hypothetical protein [Klebsiella michiganensis]